MANIVKYLFKTKLPDTCKLPEQQVEILEKLEWTGFFFNYLYLNDYQKTDTEKRQSVSLINIALRPWQPPSSHCR